MDKKQEAEYVGSDAFWQRLQGRLEARVAEHDGVGAAAALDLTTGRAAGANADLLLPIASTMKIHLISVLGQLAHDGVVNLDERVQIDVKVPGSGIITYLDDLHELTWRDLANVMIVVSDNTATNMIIELLGYQRISDFLERWGLRNTRIQRLMQDQEAVAEGRENLASANDLLRMLSVLHGCQDIAPSAAEWVLDVLAKPKKSPFASTLPASVRLSNKPGGMERVRCDAGIVWLEHRPFAMAVMSAFGPPDPESQVRWVADMGRYVFDAMSILDVTSIHGQGVPREHRRANVAREMHARPTPSSDGTGAEPHRP